MQNSYAAKLLKSPLGAKLSKYTAGSVIAFFCSAIAFPIAYALGAGSTASTIIGWLAGAVPNYFLNRNWTWGRKGRHDVLREVLPYAVIILITVGLASLSTHYTELLVPKLTDAHWLQVGLVSGVFLLTYVVLFAARFVLLDRLFRGRNSRAQVPSTTREKRQP